MSEHEDLIASFRWDIAALKVELEASKKRESEHKHQIHELRCRCEAMVSAMETMRASHYQLSNEIARLKNQSCFDPIQEMIARHADPEGKTPSAVHSAMMCMEIDAMKNRQSPPVVTHFVAIDQEPEWEE